MQSNLMVLMKKNLLVSENEFNEAEKKLSSEIKEAIRTRILENIK